MKKFLLKIPLNRCPICRENRSNIWLKEVRRIGSNEYSVLDKCGETIAFGVHVPKETCCTNVI